MTLKLPVDLKKSVRGSVFPTKKKKKQPMVIYTPKLQLKTKTLLRSHKNSL